MVQGISGRASYHVGLDVARKATIHPRSQIVIIKLQYVRKEVI
ncbi:hypothetical protein HanRHA438_Chr15g0724131 [Helianthus annuus]|nr:hypothetical protein HanRHA438_Chr15g0724131 [Helianthus annuus]